MNTLEFVIWKNTLVPYEPLTVIDASCFSQPSIVCSIEELGDSFCASTA
jgi:hypothetical protein